MIEFTEIELFYPDLSEQLEGLRILHAGDLHSHKYGAGEQALGQLLSEENDLVVFSGDFCHQVRFGNPFVEDCHHSGTLPVGLSRKGIVFEPHIDEALEVARELLEKCRGNVGFYAVQGNHDPDEFIAKLKGVGVVVLDNQCRQVEVPGGEKINVCGLGSYGRATIDVPKALLGMEKDLFTIGISHFPEMTEPLAGAGLELVLSGHTHGGQICLPGRRPLITHSRTGFKYATGLSRIENGYQYTTRGVGASIFPLRCFCPPEIVRYTICKGLSKRTTIRAKRL